MTTKASDSCLVCGGASLEPLISIRDVPTLCNRLCASEAEAANAPRGDISLIYCLDCGHVVNSAFDQARVNYDGRFENTLTFSFTIGNDAYNWAWTACVKDTVSRDGLGLPGSHGCGARRVLRTASYLG